MVEKRAEADVCEMQIFASLQGSRQRMAAWVASDWTRRWHSIPKTQEDPQLSPVLLRDQGHWTSDLWIWQRGVREGTSQDVVG